MSIEQFTVQPASNILVNIAFAGLIALGFVLIITSFSSRLLKAIKPFSSFSLSSRIIDNKYKFAVGGILTIALAGGSFFAFYAPSTVTVGSGYITVHFSTLSPIPFIGGDKTVTSSEISTAFVGQIGSGNFTLDKLYGANAGDINTGVYTLGNGATAYIASTNSTDLIIQLNSGQYLILGTSNTNALATSFSQNVYPLQS
jgi:hypothetical protein